MIKDFLIALGNFRKYGVLAERKGIRTAGYSILLLLVCSIGLIIVPTFTMGAKTLGVIWEDVPEFTLTSEKLTVEKDFDIELYGIKIFVTNNRQVSETDFDENVISGILMDEDSVIMRNFKEIREFRYNEFGENFVITKEHLSYLKPVLIMSGVLVCMMLFVSHCITFALNGLFIGAVAGIISMFMKVRVPTGKLIKLGMYAQTLPLAATSVLGLLGIMGESMFLYVISLVLIVLWMRSCRENRSVNGTEN